MDKRFSLSGKRALITGSSRGIGRAIALSFAEAGADVVVHYVGNSECADETVKLIKGMHRDSFSIKANLADEDCADVIWKQLNEHFDGVDILVLNASHQIKKPWAEITASDFDLQMSINVRASMMLIQKAVPYMKSNGSGRVLSVGSVQELKPHPDMLVYSSSKAAQTMMIRSLAAQLAPFGITVNNIAPGVIMTDRNKDAYIDEIYRKQVTGLIPIGFWGEPEDCSGPALLLCSEAGRYITGQSLMIDGGKSL